MIDFEIFFIFFSISFLITIFIFVLLAIGELVEKLTRIYSQLDYINNNIAKRIYTIPRKNLV